MDQNNGGILGKINTPTTTVASGVWSLDSQFEAQSSSIWPLAFPQTTIANSCRFNSGSSDALTRDITSNGNKKLFTFSFWVKRSVLGSEQRILMGDDGGSGEDFFQFNSNDKMKFASANGVSYLLDLDSTRVFRDTSAWYHLVLVYDSAQSTASNRVKLYVNGEQETLTGTFPAQNNDILFWNTSGADIDIGARTKNSNLYFNGYLAEFFFIDGQALDPTSFGIFNTVSNIWEPRAYAGTYGTNGFRLDFADSSALGNDVSGNNHDFTVNNLTSIDQSTDTCSNNFAVLNPLTNGDSDITLSQGNLDYTNSGTGDEVVFASIGVSSGKWYFETKYTDASQYMDIGVGSANEGDIGSPRSDAEGTGYYMIQLRTSSPGTRAFDNGSAGSGLGNSALNDINMFAIDMDNNKFYAGKNGTWYSSGDPANNSNPLITMDDGFTTLIPIVCGKSNSAVSVNFGSPSYSISSGNADANGFGNFEYAVPSGFFAFCTKNLAEHG